MGLFDYIKCEHPLPDGFDPGSLEWQSKSLDDVGHGCYLRTFRITADGRLIGPDGDEVKDYHGDLELYGSNIHGAGQGAYCTENDDPPVSRAYVARFTDGRLSKITGGDDLADWLGDKKHIPRAEFDKL